MLPKAMQRAGGGGATAWEAFLPSSRIASTAPEADGKMSGAGARRKCVAVLSCRCWTVAQDMTCAGRPGPAAECPHPRSTVQSMAGYPTPSPPPPVTQGQAVTGERPGSQDSRPGTADFAAAMEQLKANFAPSLVAALEADVPHYGTDYRALMQNLLDLMGRTYKMFNLYTRAKARSACSFPHRPAGGRGKGKGWGLVSLLHRHT